MDRTYLRFIAAGSGKQIVDALTEQQHLSPHQGLELAISAAGAKVGFCTEAARRAMETLQMDANAAIGRLRRTEILQLSHTILRNWRQSVGQGTQQSQPTY